MSDFILKSQKSDFRSNLRKVNGELYEKVKDLAMKLVDKQINSSRRNAESNRVSRKKLKSLERIVNLRQTPPVINLEPCSRNPVPSGKIQNSSEINVNNMSKLAIPKNDNPEAGGMSVISPLMKIMRDQKDSKDRRDAKKQQKKLDQSEFELKLEELAQPLLKPVQAKTKSHPHPSKHNSEINVLNKLSSIQVRSVSQVPVRTSEKLISQQPKSCLNISNCEHENLDYQRPGRKESVLVNLKSCERPKKLVQKSPDCNPMLSILKPIGSQVKNIEKLPLIHRRVKKVSSNSVNSYVVTTKNSSLHSEKGCLPAVKPAHAGIVKTPLASISQSSSVSMSNNSHIELGHENGGQSGDLGVHIAVGTFDKQMNLTGDSLISQENEVMFLSQNSSR